MRKTPLAEFDYRDFQRQMKELGLKFEILSGTDVARAQASTLNKGAQRVRTAGVKEAAGKLSVPQKLIRPRVKIHRANSKKMTASVWAGMSRGVALIHLKPKVVGGGIAAGPYLVPDGFIATPTKNPVSDTKGRKDPSSGLVGRTQVFKRLTSNRYPLEAQKVNIYPVMAPALKKRAAHYMRTEMRKILLEEYKFRVLRKAGIA